MSFNKVSSLSRPRSTLIRASLVAATIGATMFGLSMPAQAETPAPRIKVDFDDLNLSNEQDVKRLYTRLRGASRSVCSGLNGRRQWEREQFRQCYDAALARAVDEVNVAQLSRLHDAKGNQRTEQRKLSAI
jgi:UrcA family protein